jgi:glycerophosphoryl diester phosphodiesterase
MAAFRKARETGAPGIELDIHVCAASAGKTGELVVVHDDTFKRTAPPDDNGGGRNIEELTLAEIRCIDVGSFFDPAFKTERPPLLEEVLEEFCPAMYVDIELKSRKTKDDPLPKLLAEKLKALGNSVRAALTVSSFNPLCLASFKTLCPDIPTATIWSADSEVPPLLRRGLGRILVRCDYLKPVHAQVNPFSRFRFSILEKRSLIPWTVDNPVLVQKLLALGCEGIITNRPQDMTALVG